jgi:TRAP-type C4-dicarboxylate transport system substrate-binding protein
MITLKAAGYQGPKSVHSRGLAAVASHLGAARPDLFDVGIENDITKTGRPARDLFGALDSGELQLCYMASGYLTARVPDLSVIDLPFLVGDRTRAYAVLDGAAGRLLAERVQRATGLRVLGFWDNGFRHISNRARPIRTVADCKGLVIRTLDSRVYQETLAAFGFVPKVTDVRDLVRAIATGEVDAQENPLTNVTNFKIYEHHPYVSLTGHLFGVALLLCSAAWFDSLPADARAALQAASHSATADQRGYAIDEDVTALATLRELGVEVLEPGEIDLPSFQQAVAELTKRETARIDPAVVDAYLGG